MIFMPCPVTDCLAGPDFMPSLTESLQNMSHRRAVPGSRLTRCAEFLGCRDRLGVSLQQRHVLLATSLVARRTGAAVAILSVIFALAHACDRCGKRLGGQDSLLPTSCGQSSSRYFFFTLSHVLLGQDLRKLFPELRQHITSLFLPVCSLFFASRCFQRFCVADKISLDVKLSQILEWIDLPLSERPSAYSWYVLGDLGAYNIPELYSSLRTFFGSGRPCNRTLFSESQCILIRASTS